MAKPLDKRLNQAKKAYRQGKRREGAALIEEILQEDFLHAGTWQYLYDLYGEGRDFRTFQLEFARKFYPSMAYRLEQPAGLPTEPEGAGEPSKNGKAAEKMPFFRRLLSVFKRKPKEVEKPDDLENLLAAAANAASAPPAPQPSAATNPAANRPTPALDEPKRPEIDPVRIANATFERFITPSLGRSAHKEPKITLIVVDDISETRENVIKLLRFQSNIEVAGAASTGAGGIKLAREVQPDVVLMDVNMPDMDGITATSYIKREVPSAQVIILTVQDDVDYMRKAMQAGAIDFLTKPPTIDELVQAVLRAAAVASQMKARTPPLAAIGSDNIPAGQGKIITIYSPKGGAGCTMLAANLAASLYNADTPVMLVDGNLQFGDLGVLFNLQSKYSLLDLAMRATELDPQIVEEVAITHSAGLKILTAPTPEKAEAIGDEQFSKVLKYLKVLYPYVIVDTASTVDNITMAAFDASDLVILLTTQDIPALASTRKFLELTKLLKLPSRRLLLAVNQYDKRVMIPPEKIGQNFQKDVSAVIPLEPAVVIPSINRGAPFMLQKEILARPIGKAFLELAEAVRKQIVTAEEPAPVAA